MKSLALAFLLAGCSVLAYNPQKEVIATCQAASSITMVLAKNVDKLSEKQVEVVDTALEVLEPICTDEEPPESALDLAKAALAQLAEIKETVE